MVGVCGHGQELISYNREKLLVSFDFGRSSQTKANVQHRDPHMLYSNVTGYPRVTQSGCLQLPGNVKLLGMYIYGCRVYEGDTSRGS